MKQIRADWHAFEVAASPAKKMGATRIPNQLSAACKKNEHWRCFKLDCPCECHKR